MIEGKNNSNDGTKRESYLKLFRWLKGKIIAMMEQKEKVILNYSNVWMMREKL